MKKVLHTIFDRLITQKITTVVGVILIAAGLFDPEPNSKFALITLGVGLLTAKDSYFTIQKKHEKK